MSMGLCKELIQLYGGTGKGPAGGIAERNDQWSVRAAEIIFPLVVLGLQIVPAGQPATSEA